MGKELGFPDHASSYLHPDHKVFLYVSSDKEIEGCCVAEPIQKVSFILLLLLSPFISGMDILANFA